MKRELGIVMYVTKTAQKDIDVKIREKDVISRSLERIALYEKLETIKIDVSDISPEQAAELIAEM